MARAGILVTGFGGPDSIDAVAPFMCNLMGREPADELVDRVCMRYLAIGGSSPLADIAGSIAVKLSGLLSKPDAAPIPAEVGMRYWHPFIDDALGRLKAAGCDRVVVVNLAAFESKVATDACRQAILEAAAPLGLEVAEAPLISELPVFVDYLSQSTLVALEALESSERAVVAFTAHSLPQSDLVDADPYVAGLERVAQEVAAKLGLGSGGHGAGEELFESFRSFGSAAPPRAWFLVYQSKGERPGAWLEPDLEGLIDACADAGVPGIVVCPIGFTTDHMETLYDLDIVEAGHALDVGVDFVRAEVPNDAESIVEALAFAILPLI